MRPGLAVQQRVHAPAADQPEADPVLLRAAGTARRRRWRAACRPPCHASAGVSGSRQAGKVPASMLARVETTGGRWSGPRAGRGPRRRTRSGRRSTRRPSRPRAGSGRRTRRAVAAAAGGDHRGPGRQRAEVAVPLVHVAGEEHRDAGGGEPVDQPDLDRGRLVPPALLAVVAPGVGRVVDVGEVRREAGRPVPQQDHRHPATVPVEVGHREGLGTDQLPHRRAPGHRVLGLAGGEPGAGVDVVAGAEPLQLAELVGLQLLEPDDVDVVLGEQVDDAGHPGHAGLLAAGTAARVAAAEHVERADREVGGRPAGRRRDRRTGRGVRRGVGGRHLGKRGGLRVRECVRRHGGRRDPGDVAVVEAAGVREAGRGQPGGEVGVAGGGAGCPGRVGAAARPGGPRGRAAR